ncbi:MAG: DNA-deoxyinosine glycosylase [Oscillospiraceae bacterium]|nr:DNA-deoxyinosine glycosylase [Oscillospiraceae bacterium]
MINKQKQIHPIPPIYDASSRVLILGSFPSVRSREEGFFYAHPQNRFWKVLAAVFGEGTPGTIEEKKAFLLRNGVALWDSIASCELHGSSDSSITHATPNDLSPILRTCPAIRIFTNGKTSDACYRRHILPQTGVEATCLPSTSPANAAWSLPRLCEAWNVIAET